MNTNIFGKTSYKFFTPIMCITIAFFTTKDHMSKSFTYLKAINSIPKMNKLYELSQNQKIKLNKKLQQNKNFPIETNTFGKAKMKLKVVTKLINIIEIQFNGQFLFTSNEILD